MPRRDGGRRTGETASIGALAGALRQNIMAGATPEQLARMHAAEQSRGIYRAWNAVVSGTREGAHVTGLRYLPDQNKLLVYLDDAVWTQEMTMLREIIRARMERAGARIDGFVFRTSKPGFADKRAQRPRRAEPAKPAPPRMEPLTASEERALDAAVKPIEDKRLRTSLKNAMKASMEWKKGAEGKNES